MIGSRIARVILPLILVIGPRAQAAGLDLHRLWEDRCLECHGHAGDFARRHLTVSGEMLQGRHHTEDLKEFLRHHYLADEEVDAVYAMLRAQVLIPPRFRKECASCHGDAYRFVKNKLELRDGELYISDNGIPVRNFLEGHVGLQSSDVEFFLGVLERIAREVHRPAASPPIGTSRP